MPLHFLDIPDDAARLTNWLEVHLTGDSLGELVAELLSVHPEQSQSQATLDQTIGPKLSSVMSKGLSALSEPEVRKLIRNPHLLLDLQERIFIEGGDYWLARVPLPGESDALGRAWSKLPDDVTRLSRTAAKGTKVTSAAATPPAARSLVGAWIGSLTLAAAAFVGGLLLRDQVPGLIPPALVAQSSCGWTQPGAFDSTLSREDYLKSLADGAAKWTTVKHDSRDSLALGINQFRQGCTRLLLAEHTPLPADDKAWLLERCHAWAKTLDGLLTDLESGGDIQAIGLAADATINKLVGALRKRAETTA